ncbi:MAG: threonine aldolase family protein [Alphaproteobacteria bacterium]
MDFTSDNSYGAAPEILHALANASTGPEAAYGEDATTARLNSLFAELFGSEVSVFPVVTGTAANCLALASFVPPHGAILCHEHAHIDTDECGAAEFFTHGAKLVRVSGPSGKLTSAVLEPVLSRFERGNVHQAQPAAISITQPTEAGTVYRPDEISTLAQIAHGRGMALHMDGARFANAVAFLDVMPAAIAWRAGVDALSFGATKGGCLCAEAVVFFNQALARDFAFRRKKAGHLLSKMRYLSVQFEAYLAGNLWLTLARHANALAQNLAEDLSGINSIRVLYPVEANAVFAEVPVKLAAQLRAEGARFFDWGPVINGRLPIRLITSFATSEQDVNRFIAVARSS